MMFVRTVVAAFGVALAGATDYEMDDGVVVGTDSNFQVSLEKSVGTEKEFDYDIAALSAPRVRALVWEVPMIAAAAAVNV